jgi:hypothetical protein
MHAMQMAVQILELGVATDTMPSRRFAIYEPEDREVWAGVTEKVLSLHILGAYAQALALNAIVSSFILAGVASNSAALGGRCF